MVEPVGGLPGKEDVGVRHGLHLRAVGGVGVVTEDDADRRRGLAEGVARHDLGKNVGQEQN